MPDGAPRPTAAPLHATHSAPAGEQTAGRLGAIHVALLMAVVIAATLLLFALAMRRGLNHDEHQFVSGATLLAREGLQPYRDFAWFHMPTLLYLNAALFRQADHLLLAARLLQVASAGVLLLLLAVVAPAANNVSPRWTAPRWTAGGRLVAGALVVLLLITSTAFLHAAGRAWNHDLPIALAVGATLAQIRGLNRAQAGGRAWPWSLLTGILLGLAAGTRLTFAPLMLPFLVSPWLWPLGRRHRLESTLALGAGLLLGLAPSFYAFALAPDAFLFGNLRYAQLNTAWYRMQQPPVGGLSLPGKLLDTLRFLAQPANLPLIALTAAALWLGRSGLKQPTLRFWLLLLAFVALGALAPTPMQMQYIYVLLPFLALGLLLALAHMSRPALLLPWMAAAALLTTALALPRYGEGLAILLTPNEWAPNKVHARGMTMAALAASGPGSGTAQASAAPLILTLAPIDPLEGGAQIEPRLASGPFGWRVAPLLTPEERARFGLLGPAEQTALLAEAPPRAIFGGLKDGDAVVEADLLTWAMDSGYAPAPMADEGMLFLSPQAAWPAGDATIRLGAHRLPTAPVAPGDDVALTLYLTSDGPTASNLNLLLRAVDATGAELVRLDGWPYGSATSGWQPGALWPHGVTFTIPATTPPGLVRVEVGLYDPSTLASVGDTETVGWITVAPASPPGAPLGTFGNSMSVLEVTAPAVAQAGATVPVTLTWRAEATPSTDLTFFAHLLPAGATVGTPLDAAPVAQADAPPTGGFAPTSIWPAGLVQSDRFDLQLPDGLAPGEYSLLLGLYDSATQQRLPLTPSAPGDALVAATLTVAP